MTNANGTDLLDGLSDDDLKEDFPWLQKLFGRRRNVQKRVEGTIRTEAEKIATEFSSSPFYDSEVAEHMVSNSKK